MSSSGGMMTFPIYGKIIQMFQSTIQHVFSFTLSWEEQYPYVSYGEKYPLQISALSNESHEKNGIIPYLEYNNMGCLTRWYILSLNKLWLKTQINPAIFCWLPDFGTNTYQPLYKTSLTKPFFVIGMNQIQIWLAKKLPTRWCPIVS